MPSIADLLPDTRTPHPIILSNQQRRGGTLNAVKKMLLVGATCVLIGGKYKGAEGSILDSTAKMVQVSLTSGAHSGSTKRVMAKSVMITNRSNAQRISKGEEVPRHSIDAEHHVLTGTQCSGDRAVNGKKCIVTGGKYKGAEGEVLERTEKMVEVILTSGPQKGSVKRVMAESISIPNISRHQRDMNHGLASQRGAGDEPLVGMECVMTGKYKGVKEQDLAHTARKLKVSLTIW